MATSEMDYMNRGGGISPASTPTYKASANTNDNGVGHTVVSGKTYAVVYEDSNSTSTDTIGGGTLLEEYFGNQTSWGSYSTYMRLMIIKATSNTLTISNSNSRVWGLMIMQLD